MDMRGLSTFIAEIRKASSNPDGEKDCVSKELAKIRAKFRESKDLSGYDRKKYICKLLYIFMLGYEIDFGHMEALRLLSGSRYTEKHIGYLACTILLHESHELLTLITNQVKMDLNSGKEFYQCLALTAIANLGGTEFAEAMAHDVQRLVIAADTRSNVRKKAALTLLRLFRKYSDIIQPEVIVAPILELLVTPDFGVVNCALSLLLGLLGKCDINLFEGCTQKCIRILSRIVLGKETPHDYIYFGVPTPWVQMKALRVLQHYPPLSDATQHGQIMNILQKIIAASEKLLKDISLTMNKTSRGMLNRSNAMNGVLLEALSLAMHYDCDASLLESTASILGRLVNEKRDTNMRYLGLSLLSRLSFCQSINFRESIREHQSIILNSLRDPDISIRRRALDLLYCMCDTNNAGDIVGELLEYLPISDYQIREDLVLKIAILSEKYSTDLSWYVNVILNVLTQAGDYVGEDVWYRLCQIVTNNPTIQKQAAEMVFTAVSPVTADETLVKVASYVLGEYGDLIARNPETNPNAQFQALNNKYLLVSPSTRTLILTCYLKLFNMFTNVTLREKIKKIFDENRSHLDPELQQRAQEYYLLCTEHESILPSVIDTMLPFVLRDTNAVFSAVSTAKGKSIAEKDVGQKKATEGENVDPAETAFLSENVLNGGDAIVTTDPPKKQINQMDDLFAQSASPPQIQTHQSIAPAATSSIDSLFGGGSTEPPHLNASAARKAVPEALPGSGAGAGAGAGAGLLEDIFGTSSGNGAPGALGEYVNAKAQEEVTSRWRALCATRQGILYEDDRVQVGCLHEYNGFNGRMTLYYGNKSVAAIENFSTSLEKTGHNLQLQIQNIANKIGAKQQIQQQVALLCGGVFTEEETPQLRITFMSSGLSTKLVLPLPVVAGRFTEPIAELSNKASFMQQWGNLSGPEAVVLTGCTRSLDISSLDQTLKNVLRMSTLRVDDVNPNNLAVACSFSITGQQGVQRSAVLIMLEVNPSASAARVSVRTVNPYISFAYINLMKLVFGVNQ